MQPDREQELVRRAQSGDKEAFATLVLKHQLFVYNLALRALGSAQEAEDVSQEAFVRAWVGLRGFRGQAQFRTWLYRIVTNLCYNRVPRLRRELATLGEDDLVDLADESFRDPAHQLVDAERRAYLQRQIEGLPRSYGVLITLRFQQDLSYEEIASVLNVPLGTVKTGLFRARTRLKEALVGYEGES